MRRSNVLLEIVFPRRVCCLCAAKVPTKAPTKGPSKAPAKAPIKETTKVPAKAHKGGL
jgi:hypothetical protein